MPKVSVLIPIFNVEKYLDECLKSVVNQTLQDIQIICINDGSTDSSLKIIKKYAKTDPRIVIIDKKNSGYGDSMNKGLKKATGEYIGIVESDDWIEADAFEKLYNLGAKHDAEVVKSNYFDLYTSTEKKHLNGTVFRLIPAGTAGQLIDPRHDHDIFWQKPAIWAGIYRNDFLKQNDIQFLPSPGASYQDTGFNFKVWASARRAIFTDDAFLHYRQDNEASSVNNPGKVFCISDEFEEIEKFLKKNGLYDTFGALMRIAKWGAYAWNIERLNAKLAEDFIKKASKEYKKDFNDCVFNFELCGPNQVRAISEIINNPSLAIKRKYARENAKVSIIVPCYNVERYVEKSIASALSQMLPEVEVILVDDGSTDGTADILETAYLNDARIRLINTPNGGQSTARNIGIAESAAPYIAFLDADDYYELDAIQNLLTSLEENNSDISVGTIRVIYNNKGLTAIEKNNDRQYYTVKLAGKHTIDESVLKKVDVSPCNKLFKREIIERYSVHFPYGLKFEDAFFFSAYCMVSSTISFLPRNIYVYNYVRHSNSTISEAFSKTSALAYDHLEIAIGIYDFMVKNNIIKKWGAYYLHLFSEFYDFALRYSPESVHNRIFVRTEGFINFNKKSLSKIGTNVPTQLLNLLPAEFNQENNVEEKVSIKVRVKNKLKKHIRPMLPKASLSYRAQRHILDSITSMHHKIDRLEQKQIALEKQTLKITQELEDLTSLKK